MKKAPKTPLRGEHSEGRSLAERTLYLRTARGLSQSELGKRSGISQSTIAHIEAGRKDPSVSTLKKIAAALDVNIAIFFATPDVLVFDLQKLQRKYRSASDLHPTIYKALGEVIRYAKDIGFL